jgi:hypothetical protein
MTKKIKRKATSEETKKKISISLSGRKRSEETKKKISISLTGRKVSNTSKKKNSLWHKGKKHSKETKEKISNSLKGMKSPFYGIKHSQERIKKNRESHIGIKHTEETKTKISLSLMGDKSNSWKGGVTTLYNLIRKNRKYYEWRDKVYKRDDYKCVYCNSKKSGNLNAHHIINFSKILEDNNIKNLEEAINCVELWNINNGLTLCKKCHKKQHTEIKLI